MLDKLFKTHIKLCDTLALYYNTEGVIYDYIIFCFILLPLIPHSMPIIITIVPREVRK